MITKKKFFRHASQIVMAIVCLSLMTAPAIAIEPAQAAGSVIGAEGGKQVTKKAIDVALKTAKGKPAMTMATTIVCLACVPIAGAASPTMCIACGILLAKTLG